MKKLLQIVREFVASMNRMAMMPMREVNDPRTGERTYVFAGKPRSFRGRFGPLP